MKLSPIFPGHIKPARVGVYQRKYESGRWLYCYWDGEVWSVGEKSPIAAVESKCWFSLNCIPWRGLAKP